MAALTKKCSSCLEEKEFSEFFRNSSKKYGDIPTELVKLKRDEIKLKRLIKEKSNA